MQNYDEWLKIAEAQSRGASGHDAEKCIALFYHRPVHDLEASESEGRPIYRTVPYVEIRVPGDPRSVVDERVRDEHKARWPAAWAAFEAKQSGLVDGTPIEQWPAITVPQVATMKHLGIFTVEQLAALADDKLGQLGPDGRKLRERAQQHLQGAGETEKDLRSQLAAQAKQISDLEARIGQLMAAPAAKPAKAA